MIQTSLLHVLYARIGWLWEGCRALIVDGRPPIAAHCDGVRSGVLRPSPTESKQMDSNLDRLRGKLLPKSAPMNRCCRRKILGWPDFGPVVSEIEREDKRLGRSDRPVNFFIAATLKRRYHLPIVNLQLSLGRNIESIAHKNVRTCGANRKM